LSDKIRALHSRSKQHGNETIKKADVIKPSGRWVPWGVCCL
jgi:hypothetical protein